MNISRKRDYLKYWRVIRYFVMRKYKVNTQELDMLLFLYSEEYFNVDKFQEFNSLLGWNKNRFNKLKKDGWIEVIRPHNRRERKKALYGLSFKAIRMLGSIYDKLDGGLIPTSKSNNPMFLSDVGFSDKVYRKQILKMNEAIRQEQCHSLE
tara:strand:- start:8467 stop:8919 length:453 start_codon:yes stop_codon:yes gene_type:complete